MAEVLRLQGMPPDAVPKGRVVTLLREAFALFDELAAPVGLTEETTPAEFAAIYHGDGANEPVTPLAEIFPRAERLALFAVTLGEPVCAKISALFAAQEFALAALLDSIASAGTDQTASVLEARYARRVTERETAADSGGPNAPVADSRAADSGAANSGTTNTARALRYSPGYCGWHVTGQRALFARLKPETIGITLGESCLMQPLKSVSGVIVYGPAEIHDFADDYPFCAECTTRGCRERL